MKRINLTAVALAITLVAGARTLTPEEALQRVALSSSPMKVAATGATSVSPKLVHTTVTAHGDAAVYLFDRSEAGYMIVSADDVAQPLLGYSDERLEQGVELPPQMQWWLGQYAREIEQAKSGGATPLALRSAGSSNLGKPVVPLCKTKWDQSAPFNNLCPKIGGQATMTGCVATAIAQILKYHEWPVKGKGSIDYTDGYGMRRQLSLASTYDWDRMLDSYAGTSTAAQKNAVALLMRNCGYAVQMAYGLDASGASEIYTVGALYNYFDYDKGARLYQRSNFGLAQWQEMIYNNLVECGPVLYCGSSHLGGHAFVCDGYSTDGFFHFNWGWSGSYDGYYQLTALSPEGQGIGGFSGGYNLNQNIVLGIRKPTGAQVKTNVQLNQQYEALTGTVENGVLTLNSVWFNYTGFDISFEVGVKAVPVGSTTGETKFIVAPYGQALSMTNGGYYSYFQFYASELPEGTWRVSLVTRPEGETTDDAWQDAAYPINVPGFVTVTRNGSDYTVANGTIVNLKVTSAELLTGLYNGSMAKMRFTVTNPNDVEVAQVIEPALSSGSQVVAEAGGEMIDLLPGESATREVTFQFDYFSGFKINTNYDLCLFDPYSDLVLYDLGKHMVKAYPGTPTLTASAFTLVGGTTGVNPNNMEFTATVNCAKGTLALPITVLITPKDGGQGLAMGNSEALFLSQGESAQIKVNVSFPTAENGTTYTAFLYFSDVSTPQVILDYMNFTVDTSGITFAEADESGVMMAYDRATGRVVATSAAGGLNIVAVNAAGMAVGADIELSSNGESAIVDFNGVSKGVVILRATDAAGDSRTMKIAL